MSESPAYFLSLIASSRIPLLADGAMGTFLYSKGVSFERCFDALNLEEPGLVSQVHREYLAAGAQIIETNTFGANRYKLASHSLAASLAEINRAGVALARQAIERFDASENKHSEVLPEPGKPNCSLPRLVAGSVGPLGVHLAPFGRVSPEQAGLAFQEQITALAQAGIDLLIIETISDLQEMRQALAAARLVGEQQGITLPVVASMTFTRDDRTLLGDTPLQVARTLWELGADLIGINCSSGPAQVGRILSQMRAGLPSARYAVMPNAGWPQQVGGRIMYPATPEYFADYARAFCQEDARLIGGCCGTTPQHIAAMRAALDEYPGGCLPEVGELSVPGDGYEPAAAPAPHSRLAGKILERKFTITVEMDPPRGLSAHKILAGASLLHEAGADAINIADSPMARMRMSPWAVCSLIQREFDIETVLHFPTRGRNLLRVQGDLLAAHALGIRNVFVVMGDPTSIGDYPEAMDDYDLVPSGLIRLIKQNFNTGLDHAGADIGQPTSFFVGCALNLAPLDGQVEIKNLHRKVLAGADFILTQPVFDPPAAQTLLQRYADQYGPLNVPILAGILPLYNARHATFLDNEVPGVTIPAALHRRMDLAGATGAQEGVRVAVELIASLRSWASGIYLMPAFNRYDLAAAVVEAVER